MSFYSCHSITFLSYDTCFVPLYVLHEYISTNKDHHNMAEFYQNLNKAEHLIII